jgi:hypothetical protein
MEITTTDSGTLRAKFEAAISGDTHAGLQLTVSRTAADGSWFELTAALSTGLTATIAVVKITREDLVSLGTQLRVAAGLRGDVLEPS